MEEELKKCLKSIRTRHMNGVYADDIERANKIIFDLIPKNAVVGTGDSTTINQIGIKKLLKKRGTKVLDCFDRKMVYSSFKEYNDVHSSLQKGSTLCDVFLTGTNAVTQDGKIVNVDATGNRTAGMFWGHPMSIIVIGKNKIVKDINEAFYRLRNIIAPNHLRIRSVELGGPQLKIPCVINGECNDCRSKDRMCNIFTIIEGKPYRTNITIIIVDEDLGLSWDNSWSQVRITNIINNYKSYVWIPKIIKN